MYTVQHPIISAHVGEPITIVFTVTDKDGVPVDVSAGTASYKIARKPGKEAILTKTEGAGVVLSSNTATVSFNTSELTEDGQQLIDAFWDQLRITLNGDDLVVAEGPLRVDNVIY